MHRPSATRILLFVICLIMLGGVSLFARFPFFQPEAVENGPEDPDEIHLAPQRMSAADIAFATAAAPSSGVHHQAGFGGNPYLVGTIVSPTTTKTEAETNIAINPVNPSNLIALITDYSLRPGNILNNGVSK